MIYHDWARKKIASAPEVNRQEFVSGAVHLLIVNNANYINEAPLFIPIGYKKTRNFGKTNPRAMISGLNIRAIPDLEARGRFIEMWINISPAENKLDANNISRLVRILSTRLSNTTLYSRMGVSYYVGDIIKGCVLSKEDLKEVSKL